MQTCLIRRDWHTCCQSATVATWTSNWDCTCASTMFSWLWSCLNKYCSFVHINKHWWWNSTVISFSRKLIFSFRHKVLLHSDEVSIQLLNYVRRQTTEQVSAGRAAINPWFWGIDLISLEFAIKRQYLSINIWRRFQIFNFWLGHNPNVSIRLKALFQYRTSISN